MNEDRDTYLERFLASLRDVYKERAAELRDKFNRSLPFQDALFDRWKRASELGFGKGASIYNSAVVLGDVRVGADTWVGPYVVLDGSGGGIDIGSTCSISSGVHIYTHDTIGWALSGGRFGPYQAPVSIGDCCHLGAQSVIRAGVNIGSRCVVAANSMVHNDVPAATIVAGTPARKIGIVEIRDGAPVLVYESGKEIVISRGTVQKKS